MPRKKKKEGFNIINKTRYELMFVQIEDRSAKFKIIYNDQNLCKTHVCVLYKINDPNENQPVLFLL